MARHISIEPHLVNGVLHLCVHTKQNDMLEFATNGLSLKIKAVFPRSPFLNPPGAEEVSFGTAEREIVAPEGHYPYDVVEESSSFKMAQGQIDIDP